MPDLDVDFHASAAQLLDYGHHLEGKADALGDAIFHEFKLAIRGSERDGLLARELAKVDALVEL